MKIYINYINRCVGRLNEKKPYLNCDFFGGGREMLKLIWFFGDFLSIVDFIFGDLQIIQVGFLDPS